MLITFYVLLSGFFLSVWITSFLGWAYVYDIFPSKHLSIELEKEELINHHIEGDILGFPHNQYLQQLQQVLRKWQ